MVIGDWGWDANAHGSSTRVRLHMGGDTAASFSTFADLKIFNPLQSTPVLTTVEKGLSLIISELLRLVVGK